MGVETGVKQAPIRIVMKVLQACGYGLFFNHISAENFAVIGNMGIAVGTGRCAGYVLRIAFFVSGAVFQRVEVLQLLVHNLAFERERKLFDGRHGYLLSVNECQSELCNLVDVASALGAADGKGFHR